MKFDMLMKLLTESPINDVELKGDWNNGKLQGWDKPSIGILKSPKGIEKLRRLWNKTSQNFDIYLVKDKNMSKQVELGQVDPTFIKDTLGLDVDINGDNITVFYTNNIGSEKMPATPWTLAHRLGHALARKKGLRVNSGQFAELERTVEYLFKEVADTAYGIKIEKQYGYGRYSESTEKILKELSHGLGTFKSARDRNLRNRFEFINELIAEFIITGKITLNRNLPKILPVSNAWGRASGPRLLEIDQEELEDVLGSAERTIALNVDWLLDGSVGNVYVM